MTEMTVHEFDEDGDVTRYDAEDRERFEITDDAQAAWAMRKLLSFRQKMSENEAIAESEIQRINEWLHRVNRRFDDDVAYFEAILTVYARRQRDTEGRKTIDTPYGSVKSRATQAKFKVTDEDEFFAWAEVNLPDVIQIKRSPSLTALKSAATVEHTDTLGLVAMTEDGEIIPGVAVEEGGVNYTVEVTK